MSDSPVTPVISLSDSITGVVALTHPIAALTCDIALCESHPNQTKCPQYAERELHVEREDTVVAETSRKVAVRVCLRRK